MTRKVSPRSETFGLECLRVALYLFPTLPCSLAESESIISHPSLSLSFLIGETLILYDSSSVNGRDGDLNGAVRRTLGELGNLKCMLHKVA